MSSFQTMFRTAAVSLSLIAGAVGQATAGPIVLWYNGDFNGANGLANEKDNGIPQANVYDDFTVTDAGGWTVTSVFSKDLMSFAASSANWAIRSGVSAGN